MALDWRDKPFAEMLKQQQLKRRQRLDHILEKLKQVGIMLESNDVLKYVDGGSIGRPHIAKALIERRYVKGCGRSFDRYLAEGKLVMSIKKRR